MPYFFKGNPVNSSYNPVNICNGLLSGLVSVTASCNNIENYSAFVIGMVGGCVYILSSKLMEKFRIDDPCSASQIHFFCGVWGVIAVGLFDRDLGVINSGSFNLLGIQILGAVSMSLWTTLLSYPYFYLLN